VHPGKDFCAGEARSCVARGGRSRAFTFVELLVIVTIIGTLMALLLPAVQSAREDARRSQCIGNQKQLASAMLNFELGHGHFPGYLNAMTAVPRAAAKSAPPVRAAVSWVVPLLPVFGHKDVFDAYQDALAKSDRGMTALDFVPAASVTGMTCPSDLLTGRMPGGLALSYVVNRGRNGWNDNPGVGVCFDQSVAPNNGVATVSLAYVNAHDGATTTLLLAETLQTPAAAMLTVQPFATPYLYLEGPNVTCPPSPVRPVPVGPVYYYRPKSVWLDSESWSNPEAELALAFEWGSLGTRTEAKITDQIVSRHHGVVIASFCDGHQTALRNELDPNVFKHLMTPCGSNYAGPDAPPAGTTAR
jgi:type II secretory pathway pseudopilin PulG